MLLVVEWRGDFTCMGNSDDYSSMGVLWEYLGITTGGALAR